MLHWADQFNICCFLDTHDYILPYHSYPCLLAAGAKKIYSSNGSDGIEGLKAFSDGEKDWLFGHFNYDVKNQIEDLYSTHNDNLEFPEIFFFVPEIIIILNHHEMAIASGSGISPGKIFDEILKDKRHPGKASGEINIHGRFTKAEYLKTIHALQNHIHSGDCYEINFCQEFYGETALINPLHSYNLLSTISPNPFSAYYKTDDKYLLCASPERYLKKMGELLISQPIKGTSKRNHNSAAQDLMNKENLRKSSKDKSENVMVVDLVRNDLSKVCREGTISVKELYGIYSFPQVHQMISTITGMVQLDLHWTDLIRATFPMGSMTGAPKKRVMELIERYEKTRRGLFSGALGYVTPGGDFDFNVVIRSILYNSRKRYLSYQVGSGITIYSEPENEYQECMLKAEAIKKVLA
jgi:para-aminobenzoate synthetase component 1